MTTTFDADAFRSADLAAFLRTLLGPIEIPDTTDVESYDLCRGCLGRSVEFSRGPAGYIDNWGWSEGGWRNFTAATLSLATKGLLVFNDSGNDIVLTRTDKPEPKSATPPMPPGGGMDF